MMWPGNEEVPMPKLPGMEFFSPLDLARPRPQVFKVVNGIAGNYGERQRVKMMRPFSAPVRRKPVAPKPVKSVQPRWIQYDGQVLRFFGWFKEKVTERREEKWRLRKCVIYYYLENDTIHISEPRVDNSGIPQGVFLKRMKVPRAGDEMGGFLNFKDLVLGGSIQIYTRQFNISSCDIFTRQFLTEQGIQVPEDSPLPEDPYTQLQEKQKSILAQQQRRPEETSQTFFSRGTLSKKQLINDRKVLRFYCVWEQDHDFYSEKRQAVLHYYLSDDTIEVLEVNDRNSGRDTFPLLLRRMRLMKGDGQKPSDFWNDSGSTKANAQKWYFFTDLRVGATIDVYGKDLLLYGCDDFTREFYNQKMNVPYEELETMSDIFKEKKPTYVREIEEPHAFSFGTDEEALQSLQSLILKPPKKDMRKFVENDGKVMRFKAKLVNDPKYPLKSRYDIPREFIVTYFLVDNTILVFEPPQRNTGIVGGRFLERQKVRKPDGELYNQLDMFCGNRIVVYCRAFELVEADDYTLSYMESNADLYPRSDFPRVMERLRFELGGQKQLLEGVKSALIDCDEDGNGFVTMPQLLVSLNEVHQGQQGLLSVQECMTVCRGLNGGSPDSVEITTFINAIN